MLSSKQTDFEIFARVCRMVDEKLHLTEEGLSEILDLGYEMNPSGQRKYAKEEVKI